MKNWQLPFLLIAVSPATTLGLVVGSAHLAERAAAPIHVHAESPGFTRLRLDRERIAAPPPVPEPASVAPLPMVVTAAASLAAPVLPDALLAPPRAVEVAPPLPTPPLSRNTPERRLKPTVRSHPALPSRPTPAARALQPDARPPSHEEADTGNFAAVANGDPPPATMRGERR
jgi:hypothetical protein